MEVITTFIIIVSLSLKESHLHFSPITFEGSCQWRSAMICGTLGSVWNGKVNVEVRCQGRLLHPGGLHVWMVRLNCGSGTGKGISLSPNFTQLEESCYEGHKPCPSLSMSTFSSVLAHRRCSVDIC